MCSFCSAHHYANAENDARDLLERGVYLTVTTHKGSFK
jgi:hypothetical protein